MIRLPVLKAGLVFVFTLNNPVEELTFPEGIEYVYQLEKGANGTPHYQGYIRSNKVLTPNKVRALCPRAHWENRRGTHEEAYAYATKEETRISPSVGNMPVALHSGKRNDLALARAVLAECNSWKDVVLHHGLDLVRAKYPNWLRETYDSLSACGTVIAPTRPWQSSLLERLDSEPDSRKILWYYDALGGAGKSSMAKWLIKNRDALVLSNAKSADIAHILDRQRIVVFDYSRSQEANINYGPVEDIKNGLIFSPKYGSHLKVFPIPHVVVFANFNWPDGKFSEDRRDVTVLSDPPEFVSGFSPWRPATRIAEHREERSVSAAPLADWSYAPYLRADL